MGSGVFKDGQTKGLLRLFIVLLLIPVFSAVKCGSLIEGEESDPAAVATANTSSGGGGGGGGGSGGGGGGTCTTASIVTISQLTGDTVQYFSAGSTTTRVAQAFFTATNTKVSKIEVNASAATVGPDSATLDLYSGGANPTAGTLLGSSTNTAIAVAPLAWYEWTFSNILIIPSVTYYAVLTHNAGAGTGIYWQGTTTNTYPSGSRWTFDSGSWSEYAPGDTAFRISTCD